MCKYNMFMKPLIFLFILYMKLFIQRIMFIFKYFILDSNIKI